MLNFTIARVILARDLFAKGLVFEAKRVLEESPESLQENILAQKILFKIAIISLDRPRFDEIDTFMKEQF